MKFTAIDMVCTICLLAGLPVQLPRRASAYDVYAARSGEAGGGLNPAAVAAAVASVSRQQQQQSQQNQQSPIR